MILFLYILKNTLRYEKKNQKKKKPSIREVEHFSFNRLYSKSTSIFPCIFAFDY